MSEAQANLRETFYQPTPHNVHSETNFLEDAQANVALEAPTVHNVQSHIQYAEDPHYHISENKQPFRQEFHQPNPMPPVTASTSACQAQKVSDSIYWDVANPMKNSKIKANIKMATVNPSEFATLQDSILEFIELVQERGSKKSADDHAQMATHWFLMIQQFAPHVGWKWVGWSGC